MKFAKQYIVFLPLMFIFLRTSHSKNLYQIYFENNGHICDSIKELYKETTTNFLIVKSDDKPYNVNSNFHIAYGDQYKFKYNKKRISITRKDSIYTLKILNSNLRKIKISIYSETRELIYKRNIPIKDAPLFLKINGFLPKEYGSEKYVFDSLIMGINSNCFLHNFKPETYVIKEYSLNIFRENKRIYTIKMTDNKLYTINNEISKLLKPNDKIVLTNIILRNISTGRISKIHKQVALIIK